MSEIKAKEYLKKYNLDKLIITMEESTGTVDEAAKSLNVIPARIAKTLSFKLSSGVILIVIAGDKKIDNSKYKEQFKEKAKMLSYEEVEPLVGHQVGGVCPFGVKENIKVYLDKSLKEYKTVYPACGTNHNAIELTPQKLDEILEHPEWIDVSK